MPRAPRSARSARPTGTTHRLTKPTGAGGPQAANSPPAWTFLSNHGHVLICLARQPDATLREVAARVGITERSVQNIVADLVEARVLLRQRDGRRNHYRIIGEQPLRHPLESHCRVAALIDLVVRSLPKA